MQEPREKYCVFQTGASKLSHLYIRSFGDAGLRLSKKLISHYTPLPYRALISTNAITDPNITMLSLKYVFGKVIIRGNHLKAVYDAVQAQKCREICIAPQGHLSGESEPIITSAEFDIDIEKLAEFPAQGGS